MKRYKYKKRPEPDFVGRKCPTCKTGDLIYRKSKQSGNFFIGCSNFPRCEYLENIGSIDSITTAIFAIKKRIDPDWGFIPDDDFIVYLHECDSDQEIKYLLYGIYSLDFDKDVENKTRNIKLNFRYLDYEDQHYKAMVIPYSFSYYDNGPSSLAIIPQFKFGEFYHHDFCVLGSDCKYGDDDNMWRILAAVEIDIHPSHWINPGKDKFRDSLVKYRVIRVTEDSNPKNWIGSAINEWFDY